MSLDNLKISDMRPRLQKVWDAERRVLDEQRKDAKILKSKVCTLNLEKQKNNTIAFVATDGGDNRIRLSSMTGSAPAAVELVRIVDSNGDVCVMEAFSGAANNDILGESSPIKELCKDLKCRSVSDLSPYLENYRILGDRKISRSAQMREYREIVEWAVLYHLLKKEWKCDTLLVREGALRTRVFKSHIFKKLDCQIQTEHERHKNNGINMYCVGVAKQTVLLNRLRFALSLENVFDQKTAQYVRVPRDITTKFYERRWLDTMETAETREYNSLANMYLVKFGDHPLDPVWPVDIAVWQEHDAEKILGYLAEDARIGFPVPDFPMCIQRAHEHAKIGGIEMSYLNDLLFEHAEKDMSEEDKEKLLRTRYLAQDVTALRYPK